VKVTAEHTDGPHLAPSEQATPAVLALPDAPDLQEELDAMISDLKNLDLDLPDEVIRTCTSLMARCTERHVQLTRVEGSNRHYRGFRTQELVKVMELIEFTYRSASRLIEIRRQDVELSR
jgi:hypothetical protein